jgi:hypothetical protein
MGCYQKTSMISGDICARRTVRLIIWQRNQRCWAHQSRPRYTCMPSSVPSESAIRFDETSHVASFGAGVRTRPGGAAQQTGIYTEAFPQSFELSTWEVAASRSSGQQSYHYGRIGLFAGVILKHSGLSTCQIYQPVQPGQICARSSWDRRVAWVSLHRRLFVFARSPNCTFYGVFFIWEQGSQAVRNRPGPHSNFNGSSQ